MQPKLRVGKVYDISICHLKTVQMQCWIPWSFISYSFGQRSETFLIPELLNDVH